MNQVSHFLILYNIFQRKQIKERHLLIKSPSHT